MDKPKNFFKDHCFALIYMLIIISFTIFVILDALVLEKNIIEVNGNIFNQEEYDNTEKIIQDNKYEDKNISINIKHDRKYDSELYVVDIKLSNIKYLKSAFASNKFGRNVEEPTSQIAKNSNAIFAVNGDFYGFRDYGFVLRNSITYRNTARPTGRDDGLIIYDDGSFKMIEERKTTLEQEIIEAQKENKNIYQVYTFGPKLIENSKITKNEDDQNEDGTKDETRNPRTAIGLIEPLHYIILCADGRSDESAGITMSELAEYMLSLGCKNAYNLDGGSSSTMYFNGQVINKPSPGYERGVSDIVYIGY